MTQSKSTLTKLTLGGALLMAACGGDPVTQPRTYTFDATGFDGLETQTLGLVAGLCPITAAVGTTPAFMTLTVAAGETLYLFKRATDGKVVANATQDGTATGAECTVATTHKIKIVGAGIGHKVFLDYANGYFSMGTSLTVNTALEIALGGMGTTDTVTMRGTGGVDIWNFGTQGTAATSQSAANLNFGTTTGLDKFVDVTFGPAAATPMNNIRALDVLDVKVSTGAGADVITAQNAGLTAVTTGFVIPLTVWAGDDADTLTNGAALGTGLFNYLDGGAGADTFVQLGKVADHIYGGTETDLVDYSSRSAALAITLGTTYVDVMTSADDGETGELDHIDGTVENVTGGTGNDVINAVLATTVVHTLRGGPIVSPATTDVSVGNDTLRGSTLVDTLWGGAGDDILIGGADDDVINGGPGSDTIDYSDHSAAAVACNLDGSLGGSGAEHDVFNTTVDIENIRGGIHATGPDLLTGDANPNIIWGGAGVDTIVGGNEADVGGQTGPGDTLYGQGGADDIDGQAGNDIIAGGDGADVLKGDAGNDLIDATEETGAFLDTSVNCGTGNDVVLYDSLDVGLGGGTCETSL